MENYYRYVDFTVHLMSYADYPLGSFVTVTELGMGTITGRIISKKYALRKSIDYTIEAISEFIPAPVPTTEKKSREPVILSADTIKAKNIIVETIEVQGSTIVNKAPDIVGEDEPPEDSGDTSLIAEASQDESIELALNKGWYYVELQGGCGGYAIDYRVSHDIDSDHSESTDYYGLYGKSGDTISSPFFLPYDTKVLLKRGINGRNGSSMSVNGSAQPLYGTKGSPSYLVVPQYGICIFADGGTEGRDHTTDESKAGSPPESSYARIYKNNE